MELIDEQYEEIEKLSGCSYSPEKIAMYLDVPKDWFLKEWNDKDSKIRYHYDRGLLITQATSDMKLVDAAKTGNITAYQQVLKQQFFQKIDNKKKQMQIDAAVSDIDKLQRYIGSGDASNLPVAEVRLYEKLDFARRLIDGFQSKSYVINCLMNSYPEEIKSRKQALEVYNDSINFFNCNNTEVTKEAWLNYYADKFEDAALLALEMNDMDQYGKLLDKAKGCRIEANQQNDFPEDMYRKPRVIYINDPKKFKVAQVDRQVTANWIDNLPDISEEDKLRLHRDNQSEEVEYEILTPPEKNAEGQN